MIQPITDGLGLVQALRVLDLRDQFRRVEDKREWLNSLEVVMTPNQVEQLRREIELDLPRDQAQQDDLYYEIKRNTVLACMDVLGVNPYITGNARPFRKLCLSDDHFRTVNPHWDAFAAHRTGRKLRSAWKNGIPWQDEPKDPPQWGIWRRFRTLITHTDLHEGPVHDAVLVTPNGMEKMKAELPFSSDIAKLRNHPYSGETKQVVQHTDFGRVTTERAVGHYHVSDQTLKLMASCGVQGMSFVLEQDVLVNDEPVDIIISPEMVQKKSAWTVLLNNGIPIEKVQSHLVEFTLQHREPPPGWKVAPHLLHTKGVGLLVDEYWATTSHNEVYFARTDQKLSIRPEQHFCAGLGQFVDPLEQVDMDELNRLWRMARVLSKYY